MSVIESTVRHMKCDGCTKEFVLNFLNEKFIGPNQEGIEHWREVVRPEARFGYCSGKCESDAALAGKHDYVAPPTVHIADEADARAVTKAAEKLVQLHS